MKRFLTLTCVLLLLLPGCGRQTDAEPAEFTTGQVEALVQGGAFSEELEELDGDVAFALYGLADAGLEREALTGCTARRSAGATCEEGAVLIFDSEDSAQAAQEALADYLAGEIEDNRDYRPAEIPKLEDALVERRGNTLALVVAVDMEKVREILEIQ